MPRTLGSQPYMPVLPTSNQQRMSSGDIYQELGPNYSSQERLVTAALRTAMIPGDEVAASVVPPIPIDPFPPRFGWPSYQDRQAGMMQILDTDRYYPNNRWKLSGGVPGAQSSARNVGVSDVW